MNQGTPENGTGWKTKSYLLGAVIGLAFGLFAAYFYTRAAEDDAVRTGKPARIQTGEVIGLGLAALAIVRQVAEMGRSPEAKRGKR
ncbi:hypothetical protein FBR02_11400 [Anaerolineae bacterium CFX9]|jgi:uncharacterized membrane protein YdjX (TVP38/TMEM64 family)|nr:hypothetical protein [Anaerolineae bacterium CFX9]